MQTGFFDTDDRLQLLKKLGDLLPKLDMVIDWEDLHPELEQTVSAHESTPINSRNNQTILSPAPNAGESHARQSRIRSPGQLLAATD